MTRRTSLSFVTGRTGKNRLANMIYLVEKMIPQARECSFALALSGEPFTYSGAIDKSPKMKTPISY